MDQKYQELRAIMQDKGYPISVQNTAIGTIDWLDDKEATTEKVEALLRQNLTAREMVKALQPIIRESQGPAGEKQEKSM